MAIPVQIKNTSLTDADVIDSIICSYFHDDIGIIDVVNSDGTINVTHAIKPTLRDGTQLDEMQLKNVEVFYPSGAYFKIKWKLKEGDKVLLVGLRDYIKSVQEIQHSAPADILVHYNRETLKAMPICGNADGQTVLEVLDDEIKLTCSIKNTTIDLKTDLSVTTDANVIINVSGASKISIKNGTFSLKDLIDELINDITSITTTGSPTVHTVNASSQATLNALKVKFDTLLLS